MPDTIASKFERDRLRRREKQIERVMGALKDRAVDRHAVTGRTPPGLQRAIADFGHELRAIRGRLGDRR